MKNRLINKGKMNNSTVKKGAKNIVLSLSSQVIIMALGLVLPRLLITGFGSEVNGFFSTVTQLYSYLEVLRAGVGMAAIQALYKSVVDNNDSCISRIVSTSKKYFKRLGYVYLGCTILLAFGFVLFGNVKLNNYEVFLFVLMQGIAGWLSFAQINWLVDLLRAEGKNYVFIAIQTTGRILIQASEIVLIYTTHNPVLVKSATLFFVFLEYIAFVIYRKKYYSRFNFNSETDVSLLKNRHSYLAFHISSLVCTNTDVVVISIFCGYGVASVYSVYYMVVAGVNAVINTVYTSTAFLLGHSYQRGLEHFKKTHDVYYLIYTTLTTSLFAVCYILMIPFIKLYTSGIEDTNYVYAYLPLLFCVIQVLTCGKNVGDITINVGGFARNVVWRAALEAGINLVVSIILVQFLSIYGVLIGTIVALSYRMIDIMIFSNRNVLKRAPTKNFIMLITNLALFFSVVVANEYLQIEINSYWQFIKYGLVVSPIILVVFFGIMLSINKSEFKLLFGLLKARLKNRTDL